MSIYKQFKTDEKLEKEGIELNYDGVIFRIARAGMNNLPYQRAMERLTKPYRRAIQNNQMSGDKLLDIIKQVYAETIILGWEGVKDENDQPLEFNKENCLKVLRDLPELFLDIKSQAENHTLFLADIREAEAKNS